jgi:serine protease inhibitor
MYTIFDKKYNEQAINKAKLNLKTYKENYKLTNKQIELGIKIMTLNSIYSMWVLEEYYLKDNKRVKPILETELERVKFFGGNLDKLIERFKL